MVVNTPRIASHDAVTKRLEMEKIPGSSLSDFYVERAENIPDGVFEEVLEIVVTLPHLDPFVDAFLGSAAGTPSLRKTE